MKQGTLFQILVVATLMLFSTSAQAGDDNLSDLEKEMISSLEDKSFDVSMKKLNKDSSDMMDSMVINRAKGETAPKKMRADDSDMVVTVRYVKR